MTFYYKKVLLLCYNNSKEIGGSSMVKECLVYLDYVANDREEFLKIASDAIFQTNLIKDRNLFYDALVQRELEITTGVGKGVAFPHASGSFVKYPFIALFRLKKAIDYKSIDGRPVDLFFVIGTPTNSEEVHLKILSRLAQSFAETGFRQELRDSTNLESVSQALKTIFKPMVIIAYDELKTKEFLKEKYADQVNLFFYRDGSNIEPFEIHIADLVLAINKDPNNRLITNQVEINEAIIQIDKILNGGFLQEGNNND